jgi:putative colanic acid biosynthesis acetyltransferase WcaF
MRAIWGTVWLLLFRPTPKVLHGWRRFLLRLFGARIGRGAVVHPSVRVWAPWNLTMGDHSCLAPFVDCYSVAPITLGQYAAVSQYSFLCAATHDYSSLARPLVVAPITIDMHAWVCADVFIGPGVRIEEGAVVGARSSVFRNVQSWTVVAGNPAHPIRERKLTK